MHHVFVNNHKKHSILLLLFPFVSGWREQLSSCREYHNNSSRDSCVLKPPKRQHREGNRGIFDGYLCHVISVTTRFRFCTFKHDSFTFRITASPYKSGFDLFSQWYACVRFWMFQPRESEYDSVQWYHLRRKV